MLLFAKVFLGFLFVTSHAWAGDSLIVKHYQNQTRYEFGLKLLDLALSKLDEPFQIMGIEGKDITEGRGELKVIDGHLDLEFMAATSYREAQMIPIKIPLYRGLLGARLLLVTPELNLEIRKVEDLVGLRRFVGGHGSHWADLNVYAANDLNVETTTLYKNLFKMLKIGRFDYFHRGVGEIWDELDRHSADLVVADNILLYYEIPVYFFVGKHRPDLAKKIEKGLRIALEDGSYKMLFQTYYEKSITRARFNVRKLITLTNPVVPIGTDHVDTSWWMPPNMTQ